MKHPLKLTLIILSMFIITQFIGLFVVGHYFVQDVPYGLDSPPLDQTEYTSTFISILIAFIIAITIIFLLTKYKSKIFLRLWFFVVVMITLGISFTAILSYLLPASKLIPFLALLFALPLALSKMHSRNVLSHNFTELFIYPGIAALFVPLLTPLFLIILLILISAYDMWAVWRSKIMQKMADYQINELKVFGGFFVPYLSKKQRQKIKRMKETLPKSKLKNKKIKINAAILGGGDVVFSIIAAGVMLKTFTSIWPAILTIIGATLGISFLLFFGKKKVYPAMPYISTGIFIAIGLSYLLF